MSDSEKWADYVVIKKKMDHRRTCIAKVLCRRDLGSSLGSQQIVFTRAQVLEKMREGYTFVTAVLNPRTQKWDFGAKIVRCKIDGHTFIKTEPDGIKEDNLDELPDFDEEEAAA